MKRVSLGSINNRKWYEAHTFPLVHNVAISSALFWHTYTNKSLYCVHMCLQQPRLSAFSETDCAKVLTVCFR